MEKNGGIIIFVQNLCFPIKLSIKIEQILPMTSQMTNRFRGKFYSNYGFLKPNDASGYSPTG